MARIIRQRCQYGYTDILADIHTDEARTVRSGQRGSIVSLGLNRVEHK